MLRLVFLVGLRLRLRLLIFIILYTIEVIFEEFIEYISLIGSRVALRRHRGFLADNEVTQLLLFFLSYWPFNVYIENVFNEKFERI